MYYSIDMNFFYSKHNLVTLHFKYDQARRRFVEWAQNEIAVVPDFHKRILLSDEAHFWLNDYVNKQNRRIWSEANPQEALFPFVTNSRISPTVISMNPLPSILGALTMLFIRAELVNIFLTDNLHS
ncbi:hypothetical protein TNCV_3583411 [Trichonephila clavipes]|nr:hypothetical protein TNCV_3583411 [Trichonephila clavipes]